MPGPAADVALSVAGLPAAADQARLEHFRIDDDHSNAFSKWKRLGSPQSPTAEQNAQLLDAGKLAALTQPAPVSIKDGQAKLSFSLPRQAVSLLVLEWQ